MIKKKILIVVGAGASKEGNLPAGYELKKKIATILDISFEHGFKQTTGDYIVCGAIQEAINLDNSNDTNINSHLYAAWRIRDAMPQAISIDSFIDAHKGDGRLELCGKLAIVRAILEAERNSLLSFQGFGPNQSLDYESLENTWFNNFMQFLTQNCRVEQLEERLSSIGLIIFNYDRCIEHFLFYSLQTYYGIDSDRAAELIRSLEIYHPYGTVGTLPWYKGADAVEFGAEPTSRQLLGLSGCIKTFTEGTEPTSSDVVAIRNRMVNSHVILFLGFAFHQQNLNLMKPKLGEGEVLAGNRRYFGTAKGISESDCDVISSDLQMLFQAKQKNIVLRRDLTCTQLLQEFWRTLSLS